jgi:cyclopropane-fatty-acyl-phospholipid synthase
MTSNNISPLVQKYVPAMGQTTAPSPLVHQATRLLASVLNASQMALAEAYINGLEIPDAVFRSMMHSSMPILFQHAPGLLAPYQWVLEESDRLAESSQELMKLQYNLPQKMLNTMLGDSATIYPKYSMGLWEQGATSLEASQIAMLDQVIDRLGIVDGDHILDFGCGWGCVPNYIMSKFPNVRLSSDRFTLYEGDLNDAQFTEKFDKILSIGVFCHVGNLTNVFQKLSSFLKSDGKVFIHIITARIPNNMSSGFTHKYIFPHGRYWNYEAIPNHSKDLKTIDQWYLNGMNYHQTFTAWLQRFDDAQAEVKSLDYGMEYAKFRRIWRFYLLLLGTAFATCDGEYNGNGQYLLTHA